MRMPETGHSGRLSEPDTWGAALCLQALRGASTLEAVVDWHFEATVAAVPVSRSL